MLEDELGGEKLILGKCYISDYNGTITTTIDVYQGDNIRKAWRRVYSYARRLMKENKDAIDKIDIYIIGHLKEFGTRFYISGKNIETYRMESA